MQIVWLRGKTIFHQNNSENRLTQTELVVLRYYHHIQNWPITFFLILGGFKTWNNEKTKK